MTIKIVENWRDARKWISMHAMAYGAAVQVAWVAIPEDMRASVPPGIVAGITIALLVLGAVGRIIDQTGPSAEGGKDA